MAKTNSNKNKVNIKEAVRTGYKLGLLARQDQLRRRLNVLENANRQLLTAITNLDKCEPLRGIVVPARMVPKIIRALRKNVSRKYYASRLTRMFDLQGGPAQIEIDEISRKADRGQVRDDKGTSKNK